MTPSADEIALIDQWQRGFPLIGRPFEPVGRSAGLDETTAIATFRRLHDGGVISRIGAVVKPHTVGASTLAAMRVPLQRLEEVAALVSAEPLVNHNYARDHAFNLWFVVAGPQSTAVSDTMRRIEHAAGLPLLDLPLLAAYHIDLGFRLVGSGPLPSAAPSYDPRYRPEGADREVLAAIEDGLPLTERPYRVIASRLRRGETEVIARLGRLTAAGVVTRLGCVVRHRALGYTANAMTVWDIADDTVDGVAAVLARHPRVTLCYRRPRRLPDWRFNLFCMVHARTQVEALATIADLDCAAGRRPHEVLFSTRCFKQRGAQFGQRRGETN